MGKDNKKKKEKIRYVDDGRTIADMSALRGKKPEDSKKREMSRGSSYRGSFKDHLETYFGAVKLMFLPMLAMLGILAVAFILLYIILSFL